MAAQYKFRLYVAGDGPHSVEAVGNLKAFCDECLIGRCEIEVVDVMREQQRALDDRVMLTPLLVKVSPAPTRRIVGNLSQRQELRRALGLTG